jgi:hypothetical protein
MIEKFQTLEVGGRKSSKAWKFFAVLFPMLGSLATAQGPGGPTFFQAWWGFARLEGLQHFWHPATLNENDLIGTLNADSVNFNPNSSDGWNMGTADNQYVLLSTNIVNGTSYTVTAWIKPDITAMNLNTFGGWIVSDRTASGSTLDFQLIYDRSTAYGTRGYWMVAFNSAGSDQRALNTNHTDNVWQHVAGVVDSVAGTIRMYVNGVSGTATTLTITPNDSYAGRASIGTASWDIGSVGLKYHGSIGRVRFYKRALSASEILKEYNQDGTGP